MNELLLEKINKDGQIFLIGSEFVHNTEHSDEQHENPDVRREGCASAEKELFFLRFAVCYERATIEHAAFALKAIFHITDSLEKEHH